MPLARVWFPLNVTPVLPLVTSVVPPCVVVALALVGPPYAVTSVAVLLLVVAAATW